MPVYTLARRGVHTGGKNSWVLSTRAFGPPRRAAAVHPIGEHVRRNSRGCRRIAPNGFYLSFAGVTPVPRRSRPPTCIPTDAEPIIFVLSVCGHPEQQPPGAGPSTAVRDAGSGSGEGGPLHCVRTCVCVPARAREQPRSYIIIIPSARNTEMYTFGTAAGTR